MHCEGVTMSAGSEPSLVDNKPPIFTDLGDRIEISWPFGRGLFWTTPDAVEGWAAGVNELRAERARLRDTLSSLLSEFGQDVHDERVLDSWSATLTSAEMANLQLLVARKANITAPELHPTRRDLDRMEGP